MHNTTLDALITLFCSIMCVANFVLGNYIIAIFLLAVLLFDALEEFVKG